MKTKVCQILDYSEIIARYISITSSFEGPCCFPVRIQFVACNSTEPPVVDVTVWETQRDGHDKEIFSSYVDQNTSLDDFLKSLEELRTVTEHILKAIEQGVDYNATFEQPKQEFDPDSDLPF